MLYIGSTRKELCFCLAGKSVPRVSDNVMQDIAKTRKQAARKLDKQKIPRRTDAQKKLDLFSQPKSLAPGTRL